MEDQDTGDNAQSSEEQSAGNLAPQNLGPLEAVAQRIAAQEKKQEQPEAAEPDLEEAPEEVPSAEPAPAEAAEDVEDEFAGLDIDDDEREFIEANPQSRLAKRIGQLVRKRKEAEEESGKLRDQLQTIQANQAAEKADPFAESAPKPEDNPFRELETTEDLQGEFSKITGFIKWADNVLDDNDDANNDEIIHHEGETSYTKKEVKTALRQARENKETFLPARYREIEEVAQRKTTEVQLDQQAEGELAWMADPESAEAKALASIVGDPRYESIIAMDPTVKYMLAHAVNSRMSMDKKKPVADVKAPDLSAIKPKPPGSPKGASAAPRENKSSIEKKAAELQQAYENSGSQDALVALRTFKHQNNL